MEGKGAGLILPVCNTETTNLQLAETHSRVASGADAVLLMDQAEWHTTGKLVVPASITIVTLPSRIRIRLRHNESVT